MNLEEKLCKKCNKIKNIFNDFSVNSSCKSKVRSVCKACDQQRYNAYYLKNKKNIKDKQRLYIENNKDIILHKARKIYKASRNSFKCKRCKEFSENQFCQNCKPYINNLGKKRRITKKFLNVCVNCSKSFINSGRSKITCDICLNKLLSSAKKYYKKLRLEVINKYGGFCECCGEYNMVFLAIDHIHGEGNKHRKEVGVGATFYRWLKKNNYPEGFRVLCHNCNAAYYQLGKCPHEFID